MPAFETAALVADLAAAVQRLHDGGAIQGDITPDTVTLDDRNRPSFRRGPLPVRLTGSRAERLCGVVSAYTAPEWLTPEGPFGDRRSDIYVLGVLLYQLLTGVLPFRNRPGSPELVQEILAGTPTPPRQVDPSIPAPLEAICLKAMALDPAARYATAAELAADLRRLLKKARKAFWK